MASSEPLDDVPDEGRDLRDPNNVSGVILNTIMQVIFHVGGFLELTCLILFVRHFFKKTEYFHTAYFYLMTLGYVVDLMAIIGNILSSFITATALTYATNVVRWYSGLYLGPWNAFLALNRCTALLFWKHHSKIWSGWPLMAILLYSCLYPFIVNGYIIFEDTYCWLNRENEDCRDGTSRDLDNFEMWSNGVNTSISVILGVMTGLARRLNLIKLSETNKKFENQLLIQSLLSSIFFGVYCIMGLLVNGLVRHQPEFKTTNDILITAMDTLSSCYYIYFHISTTILLFILSKTVRESYIKFYRLDQLIHHCYYKHRPNYRRASGRDSRIRSQINVF